jgi:drug/metabolite transporter (DMT)-like permease
VLSIWQYHHEVPISVFYPVITLAILGSVITSIAYFYLINISGSLFASTVSYLTPVVAILLGLYDGEKLFLIQYLGILVLLSGIVFTRFDVKKSVQRTTN